MAILYGIDANISQDFKWLPSNKNGKHSVSKDGVKECSNCIKPHAFRKNLEKLLNG